jgi:electron transfer flavoprotein beta subunit
LDGGVKAVFKIKTPALLTCQLGLNTPRYPTLPNIMKAKKKELNTVEAGELLKKTEAAVATEKVYVPEKKGGGLVLEGEVGELAEKLITILREKTAVLK